MSYRFMRMMIFFDLPTDTIKDRREYARFRKYLIKNGFVMMQESVYCKLILNQSAVRPAADGIRKNRPPKGLVQMPFVPRVLLFTIILRNCGNGFYRAAVCLRRTEGLMI